MTAGGLVQHDSNGPDLSERLGRVRVDDDDDDEALPPPPNLNLAGAKAKAPGRARPSAKWMLEKRGQL